MKKFYRFLAVAFAFAFVLGSPAMTATCHAQGFNADSPEDTTDRGKAPSDFYGDSGSSSSGSSSSSDSSSSYNSSHHDSGSYDNGSSYESGGLGFNADSPEDTTDRGESPADAWSDTASAPAKNPNDVTVGVTGGQKFRIVMSADHKDYQVYHCGVSKATFMVAGADGKAVAYKTVELKQGEDKLWYADITFAEGTDTTGYTVVAAKGDAAYLSTELGVSGIKVNGVLALSTVPVKK